MPAHVALRDTLGAYELPSFPTVVASVLDAVRDPHQGLAKIADILAPDPRLSVRVLAAANSAAFGGGRTVTNIRQAVGLLGALNVESIALSVGVRGALNAPDVPGFDQKRFWLTAARRAIVARTLAAKYEPEEASICFTVGLLQDMAVPMLVAARREAYTLILSRARQGHHDLASLERKSLGMDHAQTGGLLCEVWELPGTLARAVRLHHEVNDSVPVPISIVADMPYEDDEICIAHVASCVNERLGMPLDQAQILVNECFSQADQFARVLR